MSQHRSPDDDTEADRPLEGRAAPTPARSAASPANPPPESWGRTLPLDAAGLRGQFAPPAAAPAAVEPAVRIARNVYASGTSGPPPEVQENAEPLRVPSNRPAPSPYQTNKSSEKGTMMMGSTTLGQPQRGAAPAITPPPAAAPAPSPHSAVRAIAHASETIPLANSDAGASPMIAVAQAAARSPRVQDPPVVAAPPAPAVRPRTQHVEPPRPASQAPDAMSADGEPLQLQLNERDVVQSQVSMPPGVTSRGPTLAIVGAVIAVAIGIALWLMSSSSKPPSAESPTAPAAPAAAAAPSAVQPAAVPAAPSAGVAPPTAPPAAAVVPSAPAAPAVAAVQPAAKPEVEEPHSAPEKANKPAASKKHASAKVAAKPAAKPKAKTKKPSSAASGAPVSDDVAAARDALRALESEPVMSVKRKPKPSEESADPSPPDPSPPAPPSPD